jgi:alpha-L-fucosidase
MLKITNRYPANLLLNTGSLPSGEIHREDVQVLPEIGKEINTKGWKKI